jgi:hypothetical protein
MTPVSLEMRCSVFRVDTGLLPITFRTSLSVQIIELQRFSREPLRPAITSKWLHPAQCIKMIAQYTLDPSIATDCGLDDRMIGVRFPAGAGKFSLRHRVQTGSGAHPASYPMGIWGYFSGVKAARA